MRNLTLSLSLALVLSSCSMQTGSNVGSSIAAGALAGGLIGAGGGAIIGSVISNGNIARSALLGAGVGVAAGAIFSGGGQNVAMNRTINSQKDQIDDNNAQLRSQQETISKLRQEMDEDGNSISLNHSRRSKVYDGPTLGTYYR